MNSRLVRAIALGGTAVAILDGLDAIIAYRVVLGLDPVRIYQFVASGLLGPRAFQGGLGSAALGLLVHCVVAFFAAAVFTSIAARVPALLQHPNASGAVYGLGVYAFMNYVVIPLSLIPASGFSLALFLNGVLGHALFVGLPIAYAARHFSIDVHADRKRPLFDHAFVLGADRKR